MKIIDFAIFLISKKINLIKSIHLTLIARVLMREYLSLEIFIFFGTLFRLYIIVDFISSCEIWVPSACLMPTFKWVNSCAFSESRFSIIRNEDIIFIQLQSLGERDVFPQCRASIFSLPESYNFFFFSQFLLEYI